MQIPSQQNLVLSILLWGYQVMLLGLASSMPAIHPASMLLLQLGFIPPTRGRMWF
jgi:hypothetical protein